MAIHNDIIWSALYSGFLQGQQGEDAGTMVALRAQAVLFANAVDAAIPNDAAISAAGGAQAAAAFTTGGGSAKTQIASSLAAAWMNGRNPVGLTPANYTAAATAIAAQYAAAVADQTIP